jgi:uncharacterized damage-inducible protein DinB
MAGARSRLGAAAVELLGEYLRKIEAAVPLLTESQVWWRANPHSNSIGNLLLHLEGNLSQWLLAGLGGQPYERRRSAEFAAHEGAPARELLARLRDVVQRCIAVAASIDDDALAARHEIQGYARDGFGVLLHAVEHMSYHTGQIVLLVKQLAGEGGIEFYPHLAGR